MARGPKPHHWSYWVEPEPNSGCWLWTGDVAHQDGRAVLTRYVDGKRRRLTAARFIWEEVNGPILNGLWVLHKCNVAACVNPDHLYLGTHKDNMRDVVRSGIRLGEVRKTHCPRGHLYDLRYFYGTRYTRICSTCNREKCRAYYLRKREAAA